MLRICNWQNHQIGIILKKRILTLAKAVIQWMADCEVYGSMLLAEGCGRPLARRNLPFQRD
jgi:hypothetical protein